VSELPEARSPFSLLEEVDEAKELLVLSYTTSLDFFERFALSHARALGAVVTVISDATMVNADPVMVRRAGSAYLDARAICPNGAFHPKLFVLVGDREARVGIGSGNLTMAGWHGNAELLTVLRGDGEGGPATIAEVAGFLSRLAASPIALGPGAPEALERVARRLDGIPASDPGPRLLDNLEAPILAAMPEQDAEEMICAAPFFDSGLTALGKLIDRFSPDQLSVLLESRTSVDGARLVELLRRRGGELRWILDEDRFHHGKLIEWVSEGVRWCLTGSPNLSGRALLESVADGGNCELALLTSVESSLAPPSGSRPDGLALDLQLEAGDDTAGTRILLLSALRKANTVHLCLHGSLDQPGRIQVYETGSDGWRTIAKLDPGHDRYTIGTEGAAVGRALRVLLDDGSASNQVFVTDLARTARPQMDAVGKARASPEEVASRGLGAQLLADVEELRGHLLRVGALVPIAGSGGEDEEDGVAEDDAPKARPAPGQDLEDYLAACDPVLGREMTDFALVLPAVPGLGGDFDEGAAGFDDDLEDDEAGELDDAEDKPPEADFSQVLAELPEKERERWRRWVEKLVARSPGLPVVVRTLALRSVLHGIKEKIWIDEAAESVLIRATKALPVDGDEPNEAELAAAGSLAAIAAVWIRSGVEKVSIRDEQTLRYEEVARAVGPLLEFRDPEQIETLASGMPAQAVAFGWVEACSVVAEGIVQPQSGPELAVRLLEDDYEIEAQVGPDGVIELLEPVPPRAEPMLCRALGLSNEDGPVMASGVSHDDTRVIAAWSAPHLVIEKRSTRRWGDLYQLPETLSPLNYTGYDCDLPRRTASWQGDEPLPAAAGDLLSLFENP
jgi:hypothetical protein